jgi:hypothetical protein
MDDDIDLENFVKPVIVIGIGIGIGSYFYKKSRIQETELITDFAIKCYKNKEEQDNFLKYIDSYFSIYSPSIDNILITHVAGDGRCFIYAFIAFLKEIGTFSISYEKVGLTYEDMEDEIKKKQYTDIVNQYIEEQCAYYRDESINYYNHILITKYPYLPIIDENTNVCSPHVLLYLSMIYSTVIIIIHYEDGVEHPTIVNGTIEEIDDYCFILCKGAHAYGMHISNKKIRKNIYEHIVGNLGSPTTPPLNIIV